WYYTLWHMRSTRPTLQALGRSCDVFACSIGDCDHSFDFVYYRGGRLVRQYVVEDPDFRGGRVVENTGEPLPGEAAAFGSRTSWGSCWESRPHWVSGPTTRRATCGCTSRSPNPYEGSVVKREKDPVHSFC